VTYGTATLGVLARYWANRLGLMRSPIFRAVQQPADGAAP
jgi:hypothetical protein